MTRPGFFFEAFCPRCGAPLVMVNQTSPTDQVKAAVDCSSCQWSGLLAVVLLPKFSITPAPLPPDEPHARQQKRVLVGPRGLAIPAHNGARSDSGVRQQRR